MRRILHQFNSTLLSRVGASAALVAIVLTGCSKGKEIAKEADQTFNPPVGDKALPKKPSRIAVKRATDLDAGKLDLTPKPTTLAQLAAVARPTGLAANISDDASQSHRYGPFETTMWSMDATVVEVVKREDGDFYMVVEGPNKERTVVEIPDPSLCAGSKVLDGITSARETVDKKFHPTAQNKKVNAKARIQGLGFFGFAPRTGRPGLKNGARLQPVTKVTWIDQPTKK